LARGAALHQAPLLDLGSRGGWHRPRRERSCWRRRSPCCYPRAAAAESWPPSATSSPGQTAPPARSSSSATDRSQNSETGSPKHCTLTSACRLLIARILVCRRRAHSWAKASSASSAQSPSQPARRAQVLSLWRQVRLYAIATHAPRVRLPETRSAYLGQHEHWHRLLERHGDVEARDLRRYP
jgi:hypothetical protein